MKVASSTWMIPGDSFTEKFETAAQMGFQGMEVRLLEEHATKENIREILKASRDTGLLLCSLLVPGDTFRCSLSSSEILERKKEHAVRALNIAAELGAPTLLAPEYAAQIPLPLFDRPRRPSRQEHELLMEFLSFISDYAGRVGAVCLLEPLNRYETHFYYTLEDCAKVIDEAEAKHVKILADLFHMGIEEANVKDALLRFGSCIGHVQIGDNNRLLPGQGQTDFLPAFRALKAIGYQGGIALECGVLGEPMVELPRCAAHLKKLIQQAEGEHEL